MPPSFGGTRAWRQHAEARAPRGAAGSTRGGGRSGTCRPRARPYAARPPRRTRWRRCGDGLVEGGRDLRARADHARGHRTHARDQGRGVAPNCPRVRLGRTISPARCSSSIAAWPSYVTCSRTPRTCRDGVEEAPHAARRAARSPSGSRVRRASARTAPRTPGALEVDGRHPPRLPDRRFAARQAAPARDGETRSNDVEVAAQELAAPQRPVGAVPRAVEDERERGPGLAVLGQAGRGVRVMVLDADDARRPARAPTSSPGTRGGGRSAITSGSAAEHREVEREVRAERPVMPPPCRDRRDVARERLPSPVRRRTCSSARRPPRRRRLPGGDREAEAGTGRTRVSAGGRVRDGRPSPRSGGESAGRGRGTRQRSSPAGRAPPRRRYAIGSSERLPLVSHERHADALGEQVVERRVGEHHAEPRRAGCDRLGDGERAPRRATRTIGRAARTQERPGRLVELDDGARARRSSARTASPRGACATAAARRRPRSSRRRRGGSRRAP